MSYSKIKPNTLKRTLQLARHVGYRPVVNPIYLHFIRSTTTYTHVLVRAVGSRYRIILIWAPFGEMRHMSVVESNVRLPVSFSQNPDGNFGRYTYFELPREAIDFRKGSKVPFKKSEMFSSFGYLKNLVLGHHIT